MSEIIYTPAYWNYGEREEGREREREREEGRGRDLLGFAGFCFFCVSAALNGEADEL